MNHDGINDDSNVILTTTRRILKVEMYFALILFFLSSLSLIRQNEQQLVDYILITL